MAVADGNDLDPGEPPEGGQVPGSGHLPGTDNADSHFALAHRSARPGFTLASGCMATRIRGHPEGDKASTCADQPCSPDDCKMARGLIQEVDGPFARRAWTRRKIASLNDLRRLWLSAVPAGFRASDSLLGGSATIVVIGAGVSAKVQVLGSVTIIDGTLNNIGGIGLRPIRSIRGTAGGERAHGEGKPDQENAAGERSRSEHGRTFLGPIRSGPSKHLKYRLKQGVGSRIPLPVGSRKPLTTRRPVIQETFMSIRILVLRVLAVWVLAFWLGGFTFYSGVVIPVLHDQLGSPFETGQITQRVTDTLNLLGIVTVTLGWLATMLQRPARHSEPSRGRWVLPALAVTTVCLVGLIALHRVLDREAGR